MNLKNYLMICIASLAFFLSFTTICCAVSQTTTGSNSPNILNNGTIIVHSSQVSHNEGLQSLSIQYLRAFDAKKVPLFMKYVIARDVRDSIATPSKEFEEFWKQKWPKPLLPLTNDHNWTHIIDNYQSIDEIYKETSSEIGFLFIIIENITQYPVFDINLEYLVYEKNLIVDNLINSSGKAEVKNIAYLKPDEAFIMLLGAYKSKIDGMPEYYLTHFQKPLNLHYLLNGKTIKQSIREPYRLNAARILLPGSWMSMKAWTGQ